MKLNRLFPAAVVAFLLFLIGCGGSGGGGGSTGLTTATTGALTTTTGSGGLTLMSDASRQTIIQAITTALATVPQTNGQWNATQAATALTKIKGLTSVTATAGGDVIALFSDGVPFSIFNSNMPLTAPGRQHRPQALPTRLPTIPTGSTVAYVLDTQAPVLAVGETQAPTQLGGMFSHAHYSPIVSTATVAVLKQLGTYKAAGMLFHGHGGECYMAPSLTNASGGPSLGWGMQTADIANFNAGSSGYNSPNYKTDLKTGALGVAMSNYDFQKNLLGQDEAGKFIATTFYFATQIFPGNYHWSFSTGSLIYLSCCEGGSPAAIKFQNVLKGLGAGAVAGWTNETQPEMMNAAQEALLSEMTGSNIIQPATPPRRPFSFTSTKTELDLQKITDYFFAERAKHGLRADLLWHYRVSGVCSLTRLYCAQRNHVRALRDLRSNSGQGHACGDLFGHPKLVQQLHPLHPSCQPNRTVLRSDSPWKHDRRLQLPRTEQLVWHRFRYRVAGWSPNWIRNHESETVGCDIALL
ncbi:MAG TPA: hypothetical protein VGL56_07415 [Fimbriimonadaceae bacterium]